jgi:hypothetical protein
MFLRQFSLVQFHEGGQETSHTTLTTVLLPPSENSIAIKVSSSSSSSNNNHNIKQAILWQEMLAVKLLHQFLMEVPLEVVRCCVKVEKN